MIKSLVLAWYGSYSGGEIGTMFSYWEQYGFFSYILPFLLIFALVFGILERAKIFKDNRSISGIIAFVVGLMALQFNIVPQFFSEIFPRLGVGLAVILVFLILLGLFVDPGKSGLGVTFLVIGVIITIVVLVTTAGSLGWSSAWWWKDNWPLIAGVVVILVAIGLIVGVSSEGSKDYKMLGFKE